MVKIHTLNIEPAVVNASCAWASDYEQLRELYESAYTGAVITRTATFNGFSEDSSNTVAFAKETVTSVNSYGYSPHALSMYLDWVYTLLTTPCLDGSPPTKPIIISITASTPTVLAEMPSTSTQTATHLPNLDPATLVGIELNTSCPNIKDTPPPAYTFTLLLPLLDVLSTAFYADPSLTIGLKLPPYLYSTRFAEVIRFVHTYTREIRPAVTPPPHPPSPTLLPSPFALPPALGGMGGEAIHPISLGNVYTFARMLAAHPDAAMRRVRVIGIGGVTSAAAAARMRAAGASVVGCATLLGREGVRAFE
ncbi:FMN-linked oxidoreductase, partial [Trametes versicolor FP-101664 SS1]|uniref:FMN-linked oxidoreductase n=1 Tax=Trametes versicolor (strain FP-101664) TaxID=717944 RepID=UPI0004623402